MAQPDRGRPPLALPEDELVWRFSRSSGPGGQHVNTSDTRVSLSLDLSTTSMLGADQRARALEGLAGRLVGGVLTVTVQQHRSQARNRELARERLRALVAGAAAPPGPKRKATRPSRGAKERRIAAKKHRSRAKRLRSGPSEDA
ncbi:ribosome-associated protein [Murinocardiopsis flavida]|uniref:Ribosome-associated protein n=1 Tax=Murinocardiopsis flavida TaxID=645275 RepID=A0A2P8CNG9_9ACTN|nr:alternative ribosome rescue aminoacyl-tRNA hydrolase ArfB [Murinocardiopsis flavida]PSK86526.1 ribosome-associated protein [Murinocardiopsis flavida]